jgi:hypothetical protein
LAPLQACLSSGENLTVGSVAFALSPTAELDAAAASDTVSTSAPLYLEVWATAHGSSVGPLFPGMALHSGDRIGLQARTSSRAHVYLLHCDANAVLSVFPSLGPLVFPADRRIELPAVGAALQLSDVPGQDTLYILASKRPLDHTDPALQAALLSWGQAGNPNAACGSDFERLLAGPIDAAARAAHKEPTAALRGVLANYVSVTRAFADSDGVVVLKFPYQHLP